MKSRNGGTERQDEMKRNGLCSSPSEPIRNAAFDGFPPGAGARPCGAALSCEGEKERERHAGGNSALPLPQVGKPCLDIN